MFNLSGMGGPSAEIVIHYGETEEAIEKELKERIGSYDTETPNKPSKPS